MKKILSIAMLSFVAIIAVAQNSTTDLRRAFLHHQGQESESVKQYYPVIGGESFVMQERWKNYQKYAKDCPAIAEVIHVVVSKTSDSGDFVIQLSGPSVKVKPDGNLQGICSLWINGDDLGKPLDVRDFTSY